MESSVSPSCGGGRDGPRRPRAARAGADLRLAPLVRAGLELAGGDPRRAAVAGERLLRRTEERPLRAHAGAGAARAGTAGTQPEHRRGRRGPLAGGDRDNRGNAAAPGERPAGARPGRGRLEPGRSTRFPGGRRRRLSRERRAVGGGAGAARAGGCAARRRSGEAAERAEIRARAELAELGLGTAALGAAGRLGSADRPRA